MHASELICLLMAVIYVAVYGSTTAIAPEFFWGPKSILSLYTVWDNTAEFFSRVVGSFMIPTFLSPYILGIDKLVMSKIYLPINIYWLGVFVWSLFYIDTTGPGVNALLPFNLFWLQVPLGLVLVSINLFAVVCEGADGTNKGESDSNEMHTLSPPSPKMRGSDLICLLMALVYVGVFGWTTATAPKFFWGPQSIFSLYTVWDNTAEFFARVIGISMISAFLSPYTLGVDKQAMSRIYLPINVYWLGVFMWSLFIIDTTGPGVNALLPFNLFWLQVPLGLLLVIVNLFAVFESGDLMAKSESDEPSKEESHQQCEV